MGNPTNELRAKLDELGVRWWTDKYYRDTNTCWRVGDFEWRASEKKDGKLLIGCTCVKYLTPEQAIAATVCEEHEMHICKRCGVAYELSIIDKGFGKPRFCPNCGYREMHQ